MRLKTLSVLAGVSAPLILIGTSEAGFVRVFVRPKTSLNQNRRVCNIYAEFDRPDPDGQGPFTDHINIVGGTPLNPMQIDVISGKFFNPTFANGDLAPTPEQIAANPNAAEDSFVTIGVKVFNSISPGVGGGQPTNTTGFAPTWPGFGTNKLSTTGSDWFVTPFDPQGDPFNPNYVAGNGEILIAQFTIRDSDGDGFVAISGQMFIQVVSNGSTINFPVSFFHVPAPGAVALLGLAALCGTRRRRT